MIKKLLDLLARLPIKRVFLKEPSHQTLLTLENSPFYSGIEEFYIESSNGSNTDKFLLDLPELLPNSIDPMKLKGLCYRGNRIELLKPVLARAQQLQVLHCYGPKKDYSDLFHQHLQLPLRVKVLCA